MQTQQCSGNATNLACSFVHKFWYKSSTIVGRVKSESFAEKKREKKNGTERPARERESRYIT